VLFIWFGTAGVPAMNHALETGGPDQLQAEARRQVTTMALVLFPAVAGLVSVAGPLSDILIGPGLRGPALAILPLVSCGALLAGLNNGYFLLPFTLAKRTRRLIVAMSVPAAINIGLNLVLIPAFGLVGAAGAYAASFAVGIGVSWLLSGAIGRLPLPGLELVKIACAAVLMALEVRMLPSLGLVADLVFRPLVGVAVYAALAWLLDLGNVRARLAALAPRLQLRTQP
jgi:O-antigen/teichoic acid export membrane protein